MLSFSARGEKDWKCSLFLSLVIFLILLKFQKKLIETNNKTIIISILNPIGPGLNKEEFLNLLENNIYSELDKIN